MFLRSLSKTLLNSSKIVKRFDFVRCSSKLQEELTVQSFCDLYINLPYNVKISPLDVHQYYNCDKLIIKLTGAKKIQGSFKCSQDGNNIKICSDDEELNRDITCKIQAPIKANINVVAKGDILAGFSNGSELHLHSISGNIIVDKYQGHIIKLVTEVGDIILNGAVQASQIHAEVQEAGSIKTKRLQGLNATLKTKNGNVSVESSYCDKSYFKSHNGNLDLQNIHKNSKVYIGKGDLKMSGLDGQLNSLVKDGNADIQISQVLNNSDIIVKESGTLVLRVSDDCQANANINVTAKEQTVDENVEMDLSKSNGTLLLTPKLHRDKTLPTLHCKAGTVNVHSASWADMFKFMENKYK